MYNNVKICWDVYAWKESTDHDLYSVVQCFILIVCYYHLQLSYEVCVTDKFINGYSYTHDMKNVMDYNYGACRKCPKNDKTL